MTRENKARLTGGLILLLASVALTAAISVGSKVQQHEVKIAVTETVVRQVQSDVTEIKGDVKELLRRNGGE